ncbi:recombinase family protein [Lysinibacillus sp. NPDC096418]|uniref:recombinase family protein n=1 Tax=Lysinibacillus sp. NPDC096418 TaxID=3364138 RepID=UPI0037F629E1
MNIGYARASTHDQTLNLQLDALTKADCIKIFEEYESGKNKKRPELLSMFDMLREGDTVIVWKLDRIGRNTKHLIEISEEFERLGVNFISLKENIDTSTATGKFFFRIMASLAEFERDVLVERTTAGLKAARARGRYGGRPPVNKNKIATALKMYDSKEYTILEICELCKISNATLYRYLKKRESIN